MARAEAPRTRDERPSPAFVIQTLERLVQENGQIVNYDNAQRQLILLINNRRVIASIPEVEEFDKIEQLVPPTPGDLIGK